MKILLLSWNFPPSLGGIEYVIKHLYQGLRAQGSDTILISRYNEADDEDKNIYRSRKPGIFRFILFSLLKGSALYKSWEFDMIVCGSVVSTPAAYLLSLIFKKPYAVLMHGSDVLYGNPFIRIGIKYLMKRARVLFANSFNTKNLLLQSGCDEDRIKVVYPGVCCEKFKNKTNGIDKKILNLVEGKRILLTVGRLIERKGVLEFIDNVMPRLKEKYPDILYLIVGDDAVESLAHKRRRLETIQKKIDEKKLHDFVYLFGNTDNETLVQLYFLSEIFVLPCIDVPGDIEGFGIVFLEAALSGTPSVATRLGGIPEAVIHDKTGLLVDPFDYDGLFGSISKMLDDHELRNIMAKNGEKRVYEHFCWDNVLAKYVKEFKSLVN